MVSDVVEASWASTGNDGRTGARATIAMSPRVRRALNTLREFMFHEVYFPVSRGIQSQKAREILTFLYTHFTAHSEEVPEEYGKREESQDQIAVDYVSGMTDQYAVRVADELRPGICGGVFTEVR